MGYTKLKPIDRRFSFLESFDLFRGLGPAEHQQLRPLLQEVVYKRREVIYFRGDPSETLYFIKAGSVKLTYLDKSGRRLTLLILKEGQPFGVLALTGEETRQQVAEALTDVTLCIIRKADLLRFLQSYPQSSLRVIELISRQMQEIEQKLEDLLFKPLPDRLAALLGKLAQQFGEPFGGGQRIGLKLTHQELADLIGSTRESTTLEFSRFRKLGLIGRCREGYIIILNDEKLKAVASSSGL